MDLDRIGRLKDLFAQVEHRLKRIEYHADGRLNIPCVNQLRYVGYHLLNYIVADNEHEILEAEDHCARALYDAYEVEALYYLKTFQDFQAEFIDLPIADSVAEYLIWCEAHESIAEFVRTHTQSHGRGAYYAGLAPHIEKLEAIQKLLPHARNALNKQRRNHSKDNRLAIVATVVAVLALIIGSAAWFFPDAGKDFYAWATSRTQDARPSQSGSIRPLPENVPDAKSRH